MRLAARAQIFCAPLAALAGEAAPADAPKAETPKAEAPKAAAKPAEAKKDAKPAAGDAAGLKTDEQKTLYMLGYVLGNRTMPLHITAAESKSVDMGFRDGMTAKKPAVDAETYGPKIQELAEKRTAKDREAAEAKEKQSSEARKASEKDFLEKAAKEKGAQKFPSGLILTIEKEGKGAQPTANDTVKVNYEGKFVNGEVFDSSYKRGEPIEFPLKGVIKCWTEGVANMKVGSTAKLVCPPDIAYGDGGHGMPGGATLIFKVELLDIVKK
jgi:FKBP-type peptidyl-prolyl cis-trans isomerase FkpA